MKKIMLTCFQSVQRKLQRKLGFFDLLGFDFMIDENFKVHSSSTWYTTYLVLIGIHIYRSG